MVTENHLFLRVVTRNLDAYVFAIDTTEKNVKIYSKSILRFVKEYTHNFKIMSVISIEQMLVIGD
jgi:hypothetical protein